MAPKLIRRPVTCTATSSVIAHRPRQYWRGQYQWGSTSGGSTSGDQGMYQRVHHRVRGQVGRDGGTVRVGEPVAREPGQRLEHQPGRRRRVGRTAQRAGLRAAVEVLGQRRQDRRADARVQQVGHLGQLPGRAFEHVRGFPGPRFELEQLAEDLLELGGDFTGARAGQGVGKRAERDHLGDEVARLGHGGGQRRGRQRQVARGQVLEQQRMADGQHEQAFLAAHVPVDGRLGQAHLGRDVTHPGQPVAFAGEDPDGRGDQLGKPLVRVAFACHVSGSYV